MLDFLDSRARTAADASINDQLRTLFRARPFTKAVPFNNFMPGDAAIVLWAPVNAHFEVSKIIIRCDTAGVDLVIGDTRKEQPFVFIMPPTDVYLEVDLDPGYRSLLPQSAQVLAWDPSASGCQIKGVVYGWEVTQDGYYR